MKILFVPNWSEGNPYQNLLKDALEKKAVEVVMSDYKQGWPSLFKLTLKYRDCNVIHFHWVNPYVAWLLRSKSNIKTWIKFILYVIDFILVKIIGKKIVWTVHNKFMHESQNVCWERKFRKLLIFMSDKILVHSGSAIPEIKNAYGLRQINNCTIIPMGNFIDAYKNNISKEEALKKLGLNGRTKVFLFFGAIRNYKGVVQLIEGFKNNEALQDATLLIAGNPFTEIIKQEIVDMVNGSQNIKLFLYFIPDDDVQIFMNAADVVIFPFQDILTSASVVLAMSFGKALIAPKKGCLADMLDEKGAYVYSKNDDLEHVLCRALTANFELMGQHNEKLIRRYNWNKMADLTKSVYEEISNKNI